MQYMRKVSLQRLKVKCFKKTCL